MSHTHDVIKINSKESDSKKSDSKESESKF